MSKTRFLIFAAVASLAAAGQIALSRQAGNSQTNLNEARTETIQRLKYTSLAALMYAADYDDVLPYVQGSKAFHRVTEPYLKEDVLPETLNPGKPSIFLFNMSLGGVLMGEIPDPINTVLLYDPTPWPDGKYVVSYADGHCRIEPPDRWVKVQKSLKLKLKRMGKPLPP